VTLPGPSGAKTREYQLVDELRPGQGCQVNEAVVQNKDIFRRVPKHELVGVVAADQIQAMTDTLERLGYRPRDVDVLTGDGGRRVLDRFGRHHGWYGRVLRGLQQLGSGEVNIITYDNALKHGGSVIGVRTRELDEALVAVYVQYGATDLVYFGAFTAWTLGDS
jgi:hypothetical protein